MPKSPVYVANAEEYAYCRTDSTADCEDIRGDVYVLDQSIKIQNNSTSMSINVYIEIPPAEELLV